MATLCDHHLTLVTRNYQEAARLGVNLLEREGLLTTAIEPQESECKTTNQIEDTTLDEAYIKQVQGADVSDAVTGGSRRECTRQGALCTCSKPMQYGKFGNSTRCNTASLETALRQDESDGAPDGVHVLHQDVHFAASAKLFLRWEQSPHE